MSHVEGSGIPGQRRAGRAHVLWLFLLIFLGMEAFASDPTDSKSTMLGEPPSTNGERTEVGLGVFVLDIDEIDDVKQTFSADLFIVALWQDPRLALPEQDREGKIRLMAVDDVWTPKILLFNDRGMEPKLRDVIEVDDLGNMKYQNRVTGKLKVDLEFQQFPFDVQQLPLEFVSYEYTTDQLQFSSESTIVGQADRFSIEGWRLKLLEPEFGEFATPVTDNKLPRLRFAIEAKRDSDYYVLTMLVPMSLIIFMAWTVFWLQPQIVPPRIAISTASIFSLIALGVSIRLGLPKVSYLTRADYFVLGCTLMVFVALAVAVIGSRLANAERMELALKINAVARWVYMILFFAVGLLALS